MIALFIFLSITNVICIEKVPPDHWYIWLHSVTVEQMNVTGHLFSLQSTVVEMKYFDYTAGKTTVLDKVNLLPKETTVYKFRGWAALPGGKTSTAAFMIIQAKSTMPVDFVLIVSHNNGAVESMRVLQFSQWNKQYNVLHRNVDQNLLLLSLKDCIAKVSHGNTAPSDVNIKRLLPHIITVPRLATRTNTYKGTTIQTDDPFAVIVLSQTKVGDTTLYYPAEMLKTLTVDDWWDEFYLLNTSVFDVEYYFIAENPDTIINVHTLDEVQEVSLTETSMVLRLTGSDLRKTTIKVQSATPFMAYCIIGPTESYTRMALFVYNLYIILVPKDSDVRHFLLLTSNMLGQIQIEDEIIPESDWFERNPIGPQHETGLVEVSNMSDTLFVREGADSTLFICYVLGLAHPPQGFYLFAADTTKTQVEMDLEELIKAQKVNASEVLFEASDYQFECPSGFYGPDCLSTCNCGDEFCNRAGSCYSASCRRGSFGPRCLLEDISVYALNSTPHELFDGDPATCVTPSDDRIEVELVDVFHTPSLTVVLKTAESVPESSFEVLLENKTDSYQASLKTSKHTDTAVDLVFADLKAFKKMTVSLKQQLQICSFHISGGINFLRKIDPNFAVVSFPLEEIAVQEQYLQALTDGDRYKTCIGATGSTRFGLQTKDMIPKLFYKVAIYTDNETAFELMYKTDTNFDYKVNLVVKPKRVGIIQLNRLVIFLTLETKSTQFSICEIEIYTDIAAFDAEPSQSDKSKDELSDSPYLYIGMAVFFVVLVVAFVCYRKRSARRDFVNE